MTVAANPIISIFQKTVLVAMLGFGLSASAQDAGVEKSIFGVQTGLLGIWTHGEFRMSNDIAFRLELGLNGSIWDGTMFETTSFALEPVLTAEPRWYYNIGKRAQNEKDVIHNSGDFISVKCSFEPDWFIISNDNNARRAPDFSIIPTWGIRRNLGMHFNYEAGLGVGYRYQFENPPAFPKSEGNVAINLHLRIGWVF